MDGYVSERPSVIDGASLAVCGVRRLNELNLVRAFPMKRLLRESSEARVFEEGAKEASPTRPLPGLPSGKTELNKVEGSKVPSALKG